MLEYLFNL